MTSNTQNKTDIENQIQLTKSNMEFCKKIMYKFNSQMFTLTDENIDNDKLDECIKFNNLFFGNNQSMIESVEFVNFEIDNKIELPKIEKQQKEIIEIEKAIVCCDFEIKLSQKLGQRFYKQFQQPIQIPKKDYEIGEITQVELNEYMCITETNWTPMNRKKYLKYNSFLNEHPIFVETEKVFVDIADVELVQKYLKQRLFLNQEDSFNLIQEAKKHFEFMLLEHYNPATVEILTGVKKMFNIKFLGCHAQDNKNQIIGQFEIVK